MTKQNTFQKTLSALRGEWVSLIGLSFLANLLLLTSSIYMLQIFDRVLASRSVDTLIWLTVIAVGATCVYGLIEFARKQAMNRAGQWIENTLSAPTIKRMLNVRLNGRGPAASLNDVNDIRSFWAGQTAAVFLDAPWTPVFIALIWSMHPMLGTVALAGALGLLTIAALNEVLTRRGMATSLSQKRSLRGEADRFAEEAETLDALGMTTKLIDRWQAKNVEAGGTFETTEAVSNSLQNLSRTLRLGLQIAILAVGAYLTLQSSLTAGGMIAASIILGRALAPVERSISAWKGFGSYVHARARLRALFSGKDDVSAEQMSLPKPQGQLAVDELKFMAPGTNKPIIRAADFQLSPGEVCVVMGPSGSGKSTLCNLLTGTSRPSFGSVRLDGASLSDWASEERGQHLGFLAQRVTLFEGTVAENIARMGDVDDSAVLKAAKLAGVHDLILSLKDGYETQLGGGEAHLSGGQVQRIGLARALYGDPSFVVLDEPNANLDTEGEHALVAAIARLKSQGCTVVVVTHQPATLRVADKLMIMKNGTMARFGDRDDVLKELRAGAQAAQSLRTGKADATAAPKQTITAMEA